MLKVHGTGNTFYIIDEVVEEEAMSSLAIKLCQDGTDGVLYVCPSKRHLSKMRIFNADGSEPEMCGNGLRCYARYELEKHRLKEAVIETLNAAYQVSYIEEFYGQTGISILLHPVKHIQHDELNAFDEGYEEHFEFYTVSNPHVVGLFTQPVGGVFLKAIGQVGNQKFSDGINVNILSIIDEGKVYVQTFERGVGITKSCGTGMTSASVHYARKYDYFDQVIEVYNDGGLILCKVMKSDKDFTVEFTGNATYMYEVDDQGHVTKNFDEETIAYEHFLKETRKIASK